MRQARFFRHIRLGIKSLLLHKLRSMLTMLGVVFGVSSVVAMLAVGQGANQKALKQIRKLGSHNIILKSVKPTEAEKQQSRTSGRSLTIDYGLTYEDLERIRTSYPAVKRTVPAKIMGKDARLGRKAMEVRLVGTTPGWFRLVRREQLAGRTLTQDDMEDRAAVCVLSERVARKLLAGNQAIGARVRVGDNTYLVVGIVRTESNSGAGGVQTPDRRTDVYIPLTTAREHYGDVVVKRQSGSISREKVELHQIIVQVGATEAPSARSAGVLGGLWGRRTGRTSATDNVVPTADAIRTGLERFHSKPDFSDQVPLTLLEQAEETQRMFNIVLGSIAGISLLVGGIGIMNIMLASVTERTREIGVRRAVGAKQRQIVGQFLIETIVLSTLGGLVGVLLGVAIPWAVERFADMPTVVTGWSIALSLGISVAVGVIFGLYPAYRAATLDPIVALRHE